MRELFFNFWTNQSFAVRGIRLLGVGVGTVLITVDIPDDVWGPTLKAIGFILAGGSSLITGTDTTPSGMPRPGLR